MKMGQMGAHEQKRQCLAGTTVGSRMAGRYLTDTTARRLWVPVSTREPVKNDRRVIPSEALTAYFLGTRSLSRCAKHFVNNWQI